MTGSSEVVQGGADDSMGRERFATEHSAVQEALTSKEIASCTRKSPFSALVWVDPRRSSVASHESNGECLPEN
jgi:hypothetical protein